MSITLGGYGGGGSSTGGASDAPTTPAASTPTATPQGPNAAGLNPAPSSVPATSLDPSIASKPLPGDKSAATAATPEKALNEKQIVQELASALGVKATKGKPIEVAVVNALADKYKVPISQRGMTTSGTGTGQGTAGQLRHNIASWFDGAVSSGPTAAVGGAAAVIGKTVEGQVQKGDQDKDFDKERAAAMKIQSPNLREQALQKINKQEAAQNNEGGSPATPVPVPDENSKALNEIIKQVAAKVGVQNAGPDALTDIAKSENLPTTTGGAAAQPGQQQTAGDAYQTFSKELSDPKTGKAFAAQQVPALEAAGLLDANSALQSGAKKQSNGTTFTDQQISAAYQQVLSQQVTNNQTEQQALTALASTATKAGGPTSEMEAYVQGVAQEFGVGLTQQQVTQIANTYGANAATADDPSSVEDEIKDSVVALYDPTNPNNPAGVADTMYTDIQQSALQYQIPISAQQIGNMVKQSLQGATVESMYVAADAAEAAATKQFQEQAQGLYPALSSQIAAGQTVQNLVAPYFNVAESITGVPASTMMADQQGGGLSKWSAFLQAPSTGAAKTAAAPGTSTTGSAAQAGPQMMTLDQWKTYLMQNPQYGFDKTQGGKDMAEQMTSAILNEFGKVNTLGGTSQPFNAYNGQSDLAANTSSG